MSKDLRMAAFLVCLTALLGLLAIPALAQPKGGALMAEDVYTPLSKGYDLMRQGKYEAAEYEFKAALKADGGNPFALNNLAALEEKKGNYKEAMAYLTEAGKFADAYKDKIEQTCFIGGLCAGVKPIRQMGTESAIVKVVAENLAKLKAKVKAMPEKPEPSTPPKMK
jgi:tetratricopeptide (TPR) repeat protein